MTATKKPHMTPIQSSLQSHRSGNNLSKVASKRELSSTSRSRLEKPDSHIFNDYKHFVDKQKKMVA